MSKKISVIVLAAGVGTRMKSSTSKLLHKIGNLELINHVMLSLKKIESEEIIVVVSDENQEQIKANINNENKPEFAIQSRKGKLGTGYATQVGFENLKQKNNNVLIIFGDTPLIKVETYTSILNNLENNNNAATILGFDVENIKSKYGRLIINNKDELEKIVEYKDASEEQKNIKICNAGIMAVKGEYLEKFLPMINNNNASGEYYLTDLIKIAKENNLKCGYIKTEEQEVMGVNSREELAKAEKIFQNNKRKEVMNNGATLLDPNTVYFSYDTEIENDVVIEQNVVFGVGVKIAKDCIIKSFSYLENCVLENGVSVGPFARIRPETILKKNVKVGNFVEIKKSIINENVKVNHLTYIGDCEIGENTNIGAGTITCNYDGYSKFKTKIGKNNFIGSNSVFISPVETGDDCLVAAGSIITKNINNNDLAISRVEQTNIENGAKKYRERKKK